MIKAFSAIAAAAFIAAALTVSARLCPPGRSQRAAGARQGRPAGYPHRRQGLLAAGLAEFRSFLPPRRRLQVDGPGSAPGYRRPHAVGASTYLFFVTARLLWFEVLGMPPEDLIDSGGRPQLSTVTRWQFAASRRTLAVDRAPRLIRRARSPMGAPVTVTPVATAGHSTQLPAAATLGALGVVYGDIGTSPLYALKEAAKAATHGGPLTHRSRPRRGVADPVGADPDHLDQIRAFDPARGQPRRRRHRRAAGVAARAPCASRNMARATAGRRPCRRRPALWRRRDHAGDLGAQRHRRPEGRRAVAGARRRAAHRRDPDRAVRHAAAGHPASSAGSSALSWSDGSPCSPRSASTASSWRPACSPPSARSMPSIS